MKFIIGKKIEMSQIWKNDNFIAVTKISAGPCKVVQLKTNEKDGYMAVQLGYGEKKPKNINKAQQGHFKEMGNFRILKEFRIDHPKNKIKIEIKSGDTISIGTFQTGDIIDVTGISKGKGFQGVVKRHHFHGKDKTHGNKDQLRMPGSIGSTGPQHVFKGMRMPGRMGNEQVTTKNLQVVDIDKENNILYIKGAVPGARNSMVMVASGGELIIDTLNDAKDTPEDSKMMPIDANDTPDNSLENTDSLNETKDAPNDAVKEEVTIEVEKNEEVKDKRDELS
jgi:large subunit ribosomal protein L3